MGDFVSASVWLDYGYVPTEGEGYLCIDTNSHPGFEDCISWALPP